MSNHDFTHLMIHQQRHRELVAEADRERLAREVGAAGLWTRLKDLVGGRGERPPRRRPADTAALAE